jgi:hypothetical protein
LRELTISNLYGVFLGSSSSDEKKKEESDEEKIIKFSKWHETRSKAVDAFGDKTYEDANNFITVEELDFYLKKKLEVPPEIRYQRGKQYYPSYHHETGWLTRRVTSNEKSNWCNEETGCIRHAGSTVRQVGLRMRKSYLSIWL